MPRPTLLLALSFLPLTACWVSEEEVTDLDGDGYTSTTGDCSENDPAISPGATELCDGIDNDCDGLVDDADAVSPGSLGSFYADVDADGFGGVTSVVLACAAPVGFVENATDCDDRLADVFPGAAERCNGRDDDCDQLLDDDDDNVEQSSMATFHADSDGDDFGDPAVTLEACDAPRGYVDNDQDCDDDDHDTNPEADEVCDALDNDCDGATDDADPDVDTRTFGAWFADVDGDGFGDPDGLIESCAPAAGEVANAEDCDDAHATAAPGLEEVPYDGLDNDCDARTDDDDLDGDGFPSATDCDDGDADVNPYAVEACDGADNDCDGATDDADADVDTRSYGTWFADADGDGYGDATTRVEACGAPAAYVSDRTDCDDTRAAVNPDGLEVEYDGLNNDCDSATRDDDLDEDGFRSGADCDDADADVNPAAAEVCGDGVDNDCNPDSGCGGSDLEATDADVIFYGDSTVATYVGLSVGGAGDVNGDGLADIIIGAPNGATTSSGSYLTGAAYVVTDAASTSGFYALSSAHSRIQGTPTSSGNPLRKMVGHAVGMLGDVTGDGNDEIVVGVPSVTSLLLPASSYVIDGTRYSYTYTYGRSGAVIMNVGAGGDLDIAGAATRMTIYQDVGDSLGSTQSGIANGGDLTGDGVNDVVQWTWLVSSPAYETVFRVYSGSATGVGSGSIELRIPDAYAGWYATADFEPVVADVNGDGRSDLLVSGNAVSYVWLSPLASTESVSTADVVYSSPGISAAVADVSGDGTPDVVFGGVASPAGTASHPVIAYYSGSATGMVSSAAMSGYIGSEFVYTGAAPAYGYDLAIGDLTGDGVSDITYSVCPQNTNTRYYSSYSYAYTFSNSVTGAIISTGTSGNQGTSVPPCSATGSYTFENGVFTMAGPLSAGETPHGDAVAIHQYGGSDGSFGASIAVPGDVNGDGIDDLLVGDVNAYTTGAAYLFYGRPGE